MSSNKTALETPIKRVSSIRSRCGQMKEIYKKAVLDIFSGLSLLMGITFSERGKIPHSR